MASLGWSRLGQTEGRGGRLRLGEGYFRTKGKRAGWKWRPKTG